MAMGILIIFPPSPLCGKCLGYHTDFIHGGGGRGERHIYDTYFRLPLLNCVPQHRPASVWSKRFLSFVTKVFFIHQVLHLRGCLSPRRCLVLICTEECYGVIGGPDVLSSRISLLNTALLLSVFTLPALRK